MNVLLNGKAYLYNLNEMQIFLMHEYLFSNFRVSFWKMLVLNQLRTRQQYCPDEKLFGHENYNNW